MPEATPSKTQKRALAGGAVSLAVLVPIVAGWLHGLDESVERVEHRISSLEARAAAADAVALRLEQRLDRIEGKLDRALERPR